MCSMYTVFSRVLSAFIVIVLHQHIPRAQYEMSIFRQSYCLVNTLPAKDGDLRLSASNACLPKTEISVFVTECVFFTSTCYKVHMFTLHDVLHS